MQVHSIDIMDAFSCCAEHLVNVSDEGRARSSFSLPDLYRIGTALDDVTHLKGWLSAAHDRLVAAAKRESDRGIGSLLELMEPVQLDSELTDLFNGAFEGEKHIQYFTV